MQCRCLTNLGSETNPYPCACTNNHNQLWKLNSDNTLRPKDDSNKCPFLIETGNSDLFSKIRQQMPSEPMLHTFFKLETKNGSFTYDGWQGQNLYLAESLIGGYTGPPFQDWSPLPFACARPSPPNVHWCISEFVPTFEYGWFNFLASFRVNQSCAIALDLKEN